MHIIVILMIVAFVIGIPLGIGKHSGKLFLLCLAIIAGLLFYCYLNPAAH